MDEKKDGLAVELAAGEPQGLAALFQEGMRKSANLAKALAWMKADVQTPDEPWHPRSELVDVLDVVLAKLGADVQAVAEAAWHLLDVHVADAEGMQSPTIAEWESAVDGLADALTAAGMFHPTVAYSGSKTAQRAAILESGLAQAIKALRGLKDGGELACEYDGDEVDAITAGLEALVEQPADPSQPDAETLKARATALEHRAAILERGLAEAIELVRNWQAMADQELAELYEHSPEMKRLRAALGGDAAEQPGALEVRELLAGLNNGACWCEMGIGNPMFRDHTESCKKARAMFDRLPQDGYLARAFDATRHAGDGGRQ